MIDRAHIAQLRADHIKKYPNRPAIFFAPHPKQELAWHHLNDDVTRFIGYGGAGNGGKSWLGCYWLTIMSMAYPGTGWGLCRRNISNLKKTTLVTLFKVFTECNIKPGIHYDYNQQLNTIKFRNGSVIFLIDLDFKPSDPYFTDLGGFELTGAFVDESVELVPNAITILNTRIGRRLNAKYGIKPKLLETFNPAKNHVYLRYYHPYTKKTLPPERVFIPSLPSDNPSPDVDEWIAGILAEGDQTTIQRLIHGNFEYDDDPRSLISTDKIADLFTNFHVKGGRKCMTVDLARLGGDRIVKIEWDGWIGTVTWWRREKLDVTGQRIETRRLEMGIGVSDVLVDEDGLGGGVVDFLKFKGFVNNSSPLPSPDGPIDPKTGNRIPENYANLKSQCGFRFAKRANENGCRLICEDEEIKELVMQELAFIKQHKVDTDDKKRLMKKEDIKAELGHSPDFAEAILMREWFDLKPQLKVLAG